MNRTYNKNTSKQRVMERRSERDKLQQFEGSSASIPNPRFDTPAPSSMEEVPHPPPEAHAFNKWGDEGTMLDPEDGGTTATPSILSSWSMGLAEDFNDVALEYVEMMGQELEGTGYPSAREPSPLAPGHLGSDHLSDNLRGRSDGPESMFSRDTETSREDSSGLGFNRVSRRRAVRELDWERCPGETSISQSVRLYLSNLDPDVSHEDNCEVVLRQILERVGLEELDVQAFKTRHVIKIEAFLRGVVLSVPPRSWQQYVRGAFSRSAPAATGTSSKSTTGKHADQVHQISEDELSFRMCVFVSMLKAERSESNEADVAVDGMRVECVLRSFAANAAEILPLQRPARTLLPPLLLCMACEMLGVRVLAPEIRDVFRQIVSDFEERAKLWMSPLQNAERYLRPLLTEFAAWLRRNRDVLYQACATEGLLRGIDPALRSSLKNQVYRSPEHFLEVLQSLSAELSDMPLPPYDPSDSSDPSGCDQGRSFDVSQTLKDVSRERFEVNGVPTEPSECFRQIRSLFLKATSSPLPETPKLHSLKKHASTETGGVEGEGPLGSETACGDAAGGKLSVVGQGISGPEVYAERCAWRVLHAASRTASGGDSFFVVQDLFGGEGVLVKTATAATERIRIVTRGMAARVTTVDKHDVYHTSDVDLETSTPGTSPRALMTITTTMKEVIQFAPYTSDDLSPHEACSQSVSVDMPHSFSRSSRFITISASLPDYPDHHLHALDSKLVAPSCTPDTSKSSSGHGRGADDCVGSRLCHRLSAFSSPLPPSFDDVKHMDTSVSDSGSC